MPVSKKTRLCKYCNIELTPNNSHRNGKLLDGSPRCFRNICKKCRTKENYEWVKKNYERVFAYHKNYTLAFQSKKNKLTKENVLEIRKLRQEGMKNVSIALKFQVSPSRISNIVARRVWKNI